MAQNGTKNLIPLNQRTKEEQKEITIKGGKASREARRRKKTTRQLLELILSKETDNKKMKKLLEDLGYDKDEITNDLAMNFAMVNKVITKGDSHAYNSIQNILGELTETPSTNEQPEIKIKIVDNEKLEELMYKKGDKNE